MAELPDNNNQEEPSSYTPASPVKRIIAWVGVVYMLIFVALNLYPFFHGGTYRGWPLLVCPAPPDWRDCRLAKFAGRSAPTPKKKSLHGPAGGGLCGDPFTRRPGAGVPALLAGLG